MTIQQVEIKKQELAVKHNCKIISVEILNEGSTDDYVCAFLREPSRRAKWVLLDKMQTQGLTITALEPIYFDAIIKDESHECFYSNDPKYDDTVNSGLLQYQRQMSLLATELKKK